MLDPKILSFLSPYQRSLYEQGLYSDALVLKIINENQMSTEEAVTAGPLTAEEQGYLQPRGKEADDGGLSSSQALGLAMEDRGKHIGVGLGRVGVEKVFGKTDEMKEEEAAKALELARQSGKPLPVPPPRTLLSRFTEAANAAINPVGALVEKATGLESGNITRTLVRKIAGDEFADSQLNQYDKFEQEQNALAEGRGARIQEAQEAAGPVMGALIKYGPDALDVGVQVGGAIVSRGKLTPALAAASGLGRFGMTVNEGLKDGLSYEDAETRGVVFGVLEGYFEKMTGGQGSGKAIRRFLEETGQEVKQEVYTELSQMSVDVASGNTKNVPKTWGEFKDRMQDVVTGALLLGGAASAATAKIQINRENKELKRQTDLNRAPNKLAQDAANIDPSAASDPAIAEAIAADKKATADGLNDLMSNPPPIQGDLFGASQPALPTLDAAAKKAEEDALALKRVVELNKLAPIKTVVGQVRRDALAPLGETPAADPVQPDLALKPKLQPKQTNTPLAVSPSDKVRVEAEKLVVAGEKKQETDRAAQYTAARKKVVTDLTKQSQEGTMTRQQRVDFISSNLADWDVANTKKNFPYTPPVTKGSGKAKATPKPTVIPAGEVDSIPVGTKTKGGSTVWSVADEDSDTGTDTNTDEDYDSDFDDVADRAGRERIYNDLVTKDDKYTRSARAAMLSGRLKIVSDSREIPGNDDGVEAEGAFDGTNVYLVPKNIKKGETVGVMAHEIKHKYDVNDPKTNPKGVRNLVGVEANNRSIIKIKQWAAEGMPDALSAVSRYESAVAEVKAKKAKAGKGVAKSDGEEAIPDSQLVDEDEIVTYFMQTAVGRQIKNPDKTVAGRTKVLIDDLRASARAKMMDVTGVKLEVTPKDLLNLANRTLIKYGEDSKSSFVDAGAEEDAGTKGKARAAPKLSVVGEGFAGFDKLPNKYKDPDDGKMKAEIDPRGSEILPYGVNLLKNSTTARISLGNIFRFPELSKGYPKIMQGLKISAISESGASYNPSTGTITVDRKLLDNPKQLRSDLLHEIQHAIQHKEGFTGGSAPEYSASPADAKIMKSFADKEAALVKKIPRGVVLELQALVPKGSKSKTKFLRELIDMNEMESSKLPFEAQAELDLNPDLIELAKAYKDFQQAYNRSYSDYVRVAGEAEANAVQERLDFSDEDLKRTPFLFTKKNMDSVRGKELTDSPIPATSKTRFSTASPSPNSQTNTPAFKKWFGESKVVDADGNPLVVYHGTAEDFEQFKKSSRDLGIHFGTKTQANHPRFLEKQDNYGRKKPPRIMPVWLSIKNPLRTKDVFGRGPALAARQLADDKVLSEKEMQAVWDSYDNTKVNNVKVAWDTLEDIIRAKGYDGLVYENGAESARGRPEDSYVVFDPIQIKSAVSNNGDFNPKNPNIRFSMKGKVDVSYPKHNGFGTLNKATVPHLTEGGRILHPDSTRAKVSAFVSSIFRTRVPTDIKGSNERVISTAASYTYEAMTQYNAVQEAVANEIDPEAANSALQAYSQLKTKQERADAFDEFQKRYPEVANNYNDMRGSIVKASREIGKGLQSSRMTEIDKARIIKIQQDLGNYITRTYAINAPTKVAAEHIQALYKTAQGRDIYRRAKEYVAANVVGFESEIHTDKKTGKKRERDWTERSRERLEVLYDQWGPSSRRDVSDLSKEEIIEALTPIAEAAKAEEIDVAAEKAVQDMLTIGTKSREMSSAARLFRGTTQDLTIVSERKDVPKVIRDLWGEQTDAALSAFTTLVRQGEFIARMQEQQRLLDEYDGEYFFNNKSEGPEDVTLQKLTSDSFGPLRGKFTTPEVKKYLEAKLMAKDGVAGFIETVEAASASGDTSAVVGRAMAVLMRGGARLGSWSKWATVVGNPVTWGLNWTGSGIQLLSNGNYDVASMRKGWEIAWKKAPGAYYKTKTDEEIKEMVRTNLLDSVYVGEIQRAELDTVIERFYKKGARSKLHQTKSWATDHYAATDLWTKIANYYMEKKFITKLYSALGEDVTPQDIQDLAAERVKKTNFSFTRAWLPAKILETGGITNFATYSAEVFRTVFGNYKLAWEDLKQSRSLKESNPEASGLLLQRSLERAAGTTAAVGAADLMVKTGIGIMSWLASLNDDDEEKKIMGFAIPEYLRDTYPVLIAINGLSRTYFDAGRLNPYGPLTESFRTLYSKAVVEGDPIGAIDEVFDSLFIFNRVLDAVYPDDEDFGPAVKSRTPAVYDKMRETAQDLGIKDETLDVLLRTQASLTPALFNSIIPSIMEATALPDLSKDGMSESSTRKFLEALGARAIVFNPNKELSRSARNIYAGDDLTAIKDDWTKYIDSQPNITPDEVLSALTDAATAEEELFRSVSRTVKAARLVGMKDSEISARLKADDTGTLTGMSKERIANIMAGKFRPTVATAKQIAAKLKEELGDAATSTDKNKVNQVNAKYRTISQEASKFNRNFTSEWE